MEDSLILGLNLPASFESAKYIVDFLVDDAYEMLYDKEIYIKSHKFGVINTLESVIACIEFNCIRYDQGFIDDPGELEELQPPVIDTWVRSSIPIHKKYVQPKILKPEATLPIDSKSSVSFKTSFYRSNTLKKKANQPERIREFPVPFPMEVTEEVISDSEEFIRLKKERDFKRKQEEQARTERLKKEEDEKKKLLARQLNGNNKNFTYDCDGKIILVNQFNNEKDVLELIEYKILAPEVADEREEAKTVSRRSGYKGREVVNQGQNSLKSLAVAQKQFKQVQSMSILEHLHLAPGVSIVTGNKPASRHLETSRKLQVSEQSSRSMKSIKEKEVALQPIRNMHLLDSIAENVTSLPKLPMNTQQIMKFSKKSSDQIKHYTRETMRNSELNANDMFNLEIISNPEWGKNPPFKSAKLPARLPKVSTAKDQWEIYGHLKKKPKNQPFISAQELWATGVKKPRDRPHIERVQKKSKDPPPPFGQTMNFQFN